jgi:hypothetical protein
MERQQCRLEQHILVQAVTPVVPGIWGSYWTHLRAACNNCMPVGAAPEVNSPPGASYQSAVALGWQKLLSLMLSGARMVCSLLCCAIGSPGCLGALHVPASGNQAIKQEER